MVPLRRRYQKKVFKYGTPTPGCRKHRQFVRLLQMVPLLGMMSGEFRGDGGAMSGWSGWRPSLSGKEHYKLFWQYRH